MRKLLDLGPTFSPAKEVIPLNSRIIRNVSAIFLALTASYICAEPDQKEIQAGRIFVEAFTDGIRETACGNQEQIRLLIRSSDRDLRKLGYACLTAQQSEKAKERVKSSVTPKNSSSKESSCWHEGKVFKCKVWFPESTINGVTTPAGYQMVEHIDE